MRESRDVCRMADGITWFSDGSGMIVYPLCHGTKLGTSAALPGKQMAHQEPGQKGQGRVRQGPIPQNMRDGRIRPEEPGRKNVVHADRGEVADQPDRDPLLSVHLLHLLEVPQNSVTTKRLKCNQETTVSASSPAPPLRTATLRRESPARRTSRQTARCPSRQ